MKKILISLFFLIGFLPALPGAEPLRERVYISTDRDVYVAGDAVWLSAWCVDASSSRLSSFSKTAYVEVHSPTGMVQTAKIALDGGRGAGRLILSNSLPTGNYRLFAYTLQGASEVGFDPTAGARTLSVFNTLSTERSEHVEIVAQAPQAPSVPARGALEIEGGQAARGDTVRITLTNRGTEPVSFSLSVRHDDGIPAPAGAHVADFVSALQALPAARGFDPDVIPEYEGEIIRARVTGTDAESLRSMPGRNAFLSAPGSGENFYSEIIDENGQAAFFTSNIYGDRELFLEIEPAGPGHLELVSPFRNLPAGEIAPLQLWSGWRPALEQRSLSMQLEKNFNVDTLYTLLPARTHPLFDERTRTRYVLDDYTRFPLMEELFVEFISEIRSRTQDGRRTLQVRERDPLGRFFFSPNQALILLDGIPVLDHERIFGYDPLLVQYVDIYENSFVFGSRTYSGVANFVTYKGTLPTMQFADNVRIVDFQGCSLPLAFTRSDFGPDYPDYRQTIYWHPALTLAPGESRVITCKTPAYGGRFDVAAEGLTPDGAAVCSQATLDVR